MIALEWRLQWRQGIPAVVLGLAACWTALVTFLPVAAPYLVFVEIMTVGTLFAGALTITDRASGAAAALAVSPAPVWARVAARLTPLALLGAAGAAPVLIAGGGVSVGGLAAVALCGLLLLGVATGVAARRDEFVGFMVALSAPMALLLALPLAVSLGLLTGPVWFLAPTTGVLALLRGESPYPAGLLLGYLALWTAAALGYAVRALSSSSAPARRAGAGGRPLPMRPRWLVFPRADLRNVTRDSLLAVVATSPLLLAAALRFGYPPLAAWRGVDLMPYLAIVAVAVHVPVSFGMTGALVVLDDLEGGTLDVVRVSPVGVRRYLAYRLGTVTVLSAAGLAVAAPLSGLVPRSAVGALVLAVFLGPLMMLATLAVARTRVQGAAADKALALPAYLPVAGWWVFAPFPAFWIAHAWTDPAYLAGGAVCLAAWLIPLSRIARKRLE